MGKNCLNCARRKPIFDGQVCGLDPEMRVNRRMYCEEWLYEGPMAVSISGISTEKYSVNGKRQGRRK